MFLVRGAQRVRKVKKLHISEKNNCDRKKIKISSNGDEKDALNSRKRMLWILGKGCESSPAGTCTGCNPSRVSNTPVGSITRLTRCFRSDTVYQCESYCAMDIHTQAEHIASQRIASHHSHFLSRIKVEKDEIELGGKTAHVAGNGVHFRVSAMSGPRRRAKKNHRTLRPTT